MQIGVIGLGRMGGNISRRLMKAGHRCVVFDANAQQRDALAKEGATAAGSLAEAVKGLAEKPRASWVMLPAGKITEEAVANLGDLLEAGDIVIDCGTSGGVWGTERGYCLMLGGPKEAVDHLDPIFAALAPGMGDIPRTPGR